MEPFYVVARADLSVINGRRETETEARELAQELCQKTGKAYIVARWIGSVEVERFPIRWVNLEDGDTTE